MTSALTDDVSDYPVFAPGMTPPRFIEDLTVTRSGNDLRLDWGAVVTDIYGKPLVPEVYEIFRAPAPAFGNDQLVKIGECAGACTSFVDPGAVLLTGNLQYRVRAVEGGGESGALGSELPDGTTLSIDRSELVPGQLVISWAPVTQTVDGERVELAHYAVYSAETPFSVEDVHAGLVPLLQTVQGTSLEVLAEGADRYYSVLAVDTRGNVSPF